MTILIICFYALNRTNIDELYYPSTFQTSDIELLASCNAQLKQVKHGCHGVQRKPVVT